MLEHEQDPQQNARTEEKATSSATSPGPGDAARPARPAVPAVTFQPPAVLFQPPELDPPDDSEDVGDTPVPDVSAGEGEQTGRRRRRRRGGRRRNKGATTETSAAGTSTDEGEEQVAASDAVAAGGDESRGDEDGDTRADARKETADAGVSGRDSGSDERGAEGGRDDEQHDHAEQDNQEAGESATNESETTSTGTGSRRRRRRRRRRGEAVEPAPDDPEVTVVKVREPRKNDEVSALEGSTRLEAKKQRRREGREAGRRRPPILTESEFLARRESVERTMVIRQQGDRIQIGVLEDDVLVEHYVARESQTSLIGNVYLGRVQNVLPSMEAAFVDIGRGRNAVLYAGEVNWDGLGLEDQPKRIELALKPGQTVLVQVTKDPVGHKGARLTSQISIPGRYLVYVPHGTMSGISRKLPDTERARLKQLLKDIVPEEAGVVVRTAAEGASEQELSRDVARLKAQWETIEKKAKTAQAPALLYSEPDLLIKVVRDLFTEDFSRLVVSGDEAWNMVEGYVSHVAPHLLDRLERWTTPKDIFASYRIDEQIAKALDRKVWLPSGGSLVIDRTEAMTVIDVNTGKFTGSGGNLEETVTKNNLEAAEEIVRQLRLRDIGGIIVIDFIDMVLESNRELVLRRLIECLGRDRTKHQVAEVTSLGLVQMTRKRIGSGLLESFSETCEACGGRGFHLRMDQVTDSGNHAGGESEGGRRRRRRRGGSNGSNGSGDDSHRGHGNGGSVERSGEDAERSAGEPERDAGSPGAGQEPAPAGGPGGAEVSDSREPDDRSGPATVTPEHGDSPDKSGDLARDVGQSVGPAEEGQSDEAGAPVQAGEPVAAGSSVDEGPSADAAVPAVPEPSAAESQPTPGEPVPNGVKPTVPAPTGSTSTDPENASQQPASDAAEPHSARRGRRRAVTAE
jgi:ribonuclease E